MKNSSTSVRAALAIALVALTARAAEVRPNDNRSPAGHLAGGKLTLHLQVLETKWNPEGENGPQLPVKAFAEEGMAPTSPGPLIRVPVGTDVRVTVRNLLKSQIVVHGLHAHAGSGAVAASIPPSASHEFAFHAEHPGVYFYWAGTNNAPLDKRRGLDGQLSGALIVDPPGAPAQADRIFVITHWEVRDRAKPVPHERETWAINGKSWPDTERLTYPAGESVRWLWLNPSDERHPMHMHGHYFDVEGAGTEEHWKTFPAADHRLVATELLDPGGSIAFSWTPERAGNWLFHCHNIAHIDPDLRQTPATAHSHEDMGLHHMAGLVMGITITNPRPSTPVTAAARQLRLVVGERHGVVIRGRPGLGYELCDESTGADDPAGITAPGPPIVLTRGQPVEIAIENRLKEATSVHWHGIELESYYDGVPGWGGEGKHITPPIRPGETFIARFTPPRAGTFIYHSHLNDYIQLSTGLYGAVVVLEPGQRFDPDSDRILVFSRGGTDDIKDQFFINGTSAPAEMELVAGKRYRLRLVGITAAAPIAVTIEERGSPVEWRPLAKDGAALAASHESPQPAKVVVNPGETYDFEFEPAEAGKFRLTAVGLFFKQQVTIPLMVQPATLH